MAWCYAAPPQERRTEQRSAPQLKPDTQLWVSTAPVSIFNTPPEKVDPTYSHPVLVLGVLGAALALDYPTLCSMPNGRSCLSFHGGLRLGPSPSIELGMLSIGSVFITVLLDLSNNGRHKNGLKCISMTF